jgi:hypothetical protein
MALTVTITITVPVRILAFVTVNDDIHVSFSFNTCIKWLELGLIKCDFWSYTISRGDSGTIICLMFIRSRVRVPPVQCCHKWVPGRTRWLCNWLVLCGGYGDMGCVYSPRAGSWGVLYSLFIICLIEYFDLCIIFLMV